MLFVVPVVLFDMLKAKQLACVSESGQKCPAARSLSLRRAWIEMSACRRCVAWTRRRSPYGERGLKLSRHDTIHATTKCRSPYGERGLKFYLSGTRPHQIKSLSLRRAWIEMYRAAILHLPSSVALLTESVD